MSPRAARGAVAGLAAALLATPSALDAIWPPPLEALRAAPTATVLLDVRGEPLRVRLGPGDLDCRPIDDLQPDDWIVRAIVAAEDRRFWWHRGVDPIAIARAAVQNLQHGRIVSGASTLSTQLIRLVEPRPRTWLTKLVEAMRAMQLERRLGKMEILRHYLNRAPFGGNLVGVEAAARRYFGKGARELSLAEAAMLAGLPQSPARLRPDRHFERAHARQCRVLERMRANGVITPDQFAAARAEALAIRRQIRPFVAPHFAEMALRGAPAGTVRTTLDPALQTALEAAVKRHAEPLGAIGVDGFAAVVIDVPAAAVRALVGSPDWNAPGAGQLNGATVRRSAGSTLKPFIFALAIEQGRLTPARMLADEPRRWPGLEPSNFDGAYRGLVSAREALVLSLNLPALELTAMVGLEPLAAVFRRAGLSAPGNDVARYGLGVALGSSPVTLLELANAYAALARGGEWRPLRWREDQPLLSGRRVVSDATAWLIADMLTGEERSLELWRHNAEARTPRIAWKTGTSAGFRDAWAVGYNPRHVIAVWCGRSDGRGDPHLVGGRVAAPLVAEMFRVADPARDSPWFPRPPEVCERPVCALSGCTPGPWCGELRGDFAVAGVTLAEQCDVHRPVFAGRPLRGESSAVRKAVGAPPQSGGPGPRILSPMPGEVIRRLGVAGERLALTAVAPGSTGLWWFVGTRPLGRAPPGRPLLWTPEPGMHLLICADEAGRAARCVIRVE
ncbi:MAG: penicillin-binding protein 1C [Kiritimatiellae bacterium]|nr:penicillin-binding protein 1C [Kiritimatiellia bacterium]